MTVKELKQYLNTIENENQPIIIEKTIEDDELYRCYETYSAIGKEIVIFTTN